MFSPINSSPRTRRVLISGVMTLLCGLALALRILLYHIETSDYTVFLSSWYDYILSHGGLAALKDSFSNYNTPYLTLLALATYVPAPKLIAIKTISVLFDGVMALFVYLILRTKYSHGLAASAGALVVLFAPTIVINSAAWGQCDAIYVSFCLGSLFFLLKLRPGWACTFFALALPFKLQAVFFAPVLFVLLLKRAPLALPGLDSAGLRAHVDSSAAGGTQPTKSAQHLCTASFKRRHGRYGHIHWREHYSVFQERSASI